MKQFSNEVVLAGIKPKEHLLGIVQTAIEERCKKHEECKFGHCDCPITKIIDMMGDEWFVD